MNQNELFKQWKDAAESGSLLVPKHDPNNTITYSSYRTVLTQQMSASLQSFIYSDRYSVNEYADARYSRGLGYFEVIPNSSSNFSVVGSEISSGSFVANEQMDRIIFVYDTKHGWKVFAESSQEISNKIVAGRFTLLKSFRPSYKLL